MTLHLQDILKTIVVDILQRYVNAAAEEIAAAMADEAEARAQDRIADLREQIERGDEP